MPGRAFLPPRPASSEADRRSAPGPPAPFVGMHDSEFYAAVAKELRAGAPVLHSVVHTHQITEPKRFRNGRPHHVAPMEQPAAPGGTASSAPTSGRESAGLEAELERISADLHLWKVQRMSEALQAKQSAEREQEMEVLMEKRLSHRQAMEQDRALHRIENIVRTIEPKMTRFVEENAALLAAEESGGGLDAVPMSPARLEMQQHDKEREERMERRVREMSDFTKSWLVERDLQRKYEERASCERQHSLMRNLLSFEEERERREILSQLGVARIGMGVVGDETYFRERVEAREEELRSDVISRMLREMNVMVPAKATGCVETEENESESEKDEKESDNESEKTTSEEAKTPSVVYYDDAAVDDRLPLPTPPTSSTPPEDLPLLDAERQPIAPRQDHVVLAETEPRPAEEERAHHAVETRPRLETPLSEGEGAAVRWEDAGEVNASALPSDPTPEDEPPAEATVE